MELKNDRGEIARLADDLTLKELVDMGFSLDICDEAYNPKEHWGVSGQKDNEREYPDK